MGDKKKTSYAEKFQIIYVAPLPSGSWNITLLKHELHRVTCLQSAMRKGAKSQYPVEEKDQHSLPGDQGQHQQ